MNKKEREAWKNLGILFKDGDVFITKKAGDMFSEIIIDEKLKDRVKYYDE